MKFKTDNRTDERIMGSSLDPGETLRGICQRFSKIGLGLSEKLRNPELVASVAWDSPEWVRDTLDQAERDLHDTADEMRALVDRTQAAKARAMKAQ